MCIYGLVWVSVRPIKSNIIRSNNKGCVRPIDLNSILDNHLDVLMDTTQPTKSRMLPRLTEPMTIMTGCRGWSTIFKSAEGRAQALLSVTEPCLTTHGLLSIFEVSF